MWVDYNITEEGRKGMRIHLKFSVYDMKDRDAYVAIYFEYDDEDGGYLKDKNKSFYSSAGEVAVYKSIKPGYNPADYNDLQIFMPYEELDLDPGTYDLSMDVKLIYSTGGVISRLTSYYFEYKEPFPTSTSTTTTNTNSNTKIGTGKFDKLWVDYDVTENGQKGMRIHVKFSVLNMKDQDVRLAIYFEMKNGDKLLTNNSAYRSKSGQVAIYRTLKVTYDESNYSDVQLFMPYSELNLGKGNHDLKLDADLVKPNGDMIKHLTFHEFWFRQ